MFRQIHAVNSFPRHEAREVSRQTPGFAFHAVGDDADGVVIEEARNYRFVGLDLLERASNSCLFVCRVL